MGIPAGDVLRDSLANFGVSVILGTALGLGPRRFRDNRYADLARRVSRLESRPGILPKRMNITQVPASPAQWGLSTFPHGVPGRLGFKVDKIVIHWMDGTLASTDKVFTGQTDRKSGSAHFGVEDSEVHQYVAVGSVAWHAGNWMVNLTSIGIEHSAEPGRDASDATYATSGELIAALWKQFGMNPDRSTLHPHHEFAPTQCCGTVDLDRLYAAALAALAPKADTLMNPPAPGSSGATVASARIPVEFTVRSTAAVHWRSAPSLDAPVIATYPSGTDVACDGSETGPSINGTTVWYRSKVHGWYSTAAYNTQL